ncbi:hypothetical protein [Nonlabens arenilitoris]|uniref:hypothetical protein n=1 Tax=Nonlabens arenilitoris TaxID=1217969 RepID=UPI0014746BB9|nr:hypothetical protein [Nonlabens arenilitoris]
MEIDEKIQLKQKELSLSDSPEKKANIQNELKKLQLRKEIEAIRKRIEQIG